MGRLSSQAEKMKATNAVKINTIDVILAFLISPNLNFLIFDDASAVCAPTVCVRR